MAEKTLFFFHGLECPHCRRMDPLIERVEKELGVTFEKHETWHNEENAQKLAEYNKGCCSGVPFFYNTATNKWLCGATDYETFKAFAQEG